MSFNLLKNYNERAIYKPNGTHVFNLPDGNIFTQMNLMMKVVASVKTSTASNAPDQQIARMVKRLELIKGSNDVIWSLGGEEFATYFTERNGRDAPNNATIAGTVADDVAGQHYLQCPFFPEDALKPWDFAVDTRKNNYKLVLTWADMTQAGVLFGTIGGTVEIPESQSYIDIELETLKLRNFNGKPDRLETISPMIYGLTSSEFEVAQDNNGFVIPLEEDNDYRNVIFWQTYHANTNQEVGTNDIISDTITILDSQNNPHGAVKVDMLREDTAFRHMSETVQNGVLDFNFTKFGSISDAVKTDNLLKLKAKMTVTKKTSNSKIRAIFVTQRPQ